ncbi:hypothetical protein EV178_003636 [Coemansia sp. RSA 1646]|nr:hypothetical protein EV178_003636 [Coemansia sp. RSA 1646]
MPIFRSAFVASCWVFASVANATMHECAKDIAIRITGIYENGDTDVHYSYCENLDDGRGYTAGIAGFCTGTGDAWMVIQEYKKLTGSYGDFASMASKLRKYADDENDSTRGIKNYCNVWKSLGKSDKNFQKAQDSIRDQLYYYPAEKAANKLGLKLDVSQGQIFDTSIQHGAGDDADGLLSLIKDTNKSFRSDQPGNSGSILNINGHQVDEIVWLKKFIEVRTNDLKHPKEEENQGGDYWAQTTYRTKSYSYMVNQGDMLLSIIISKLILVSYLAFMPTASAAMCGCAKDIAIRITGIYENGDTDVHYDYCENLDDGRGFTAGIAGFCSGTGDGWDVIQEYKKLTGSYGDFEAMAADLEKYASSESDSTSGIENYCKVWESLGKSDKNFQKAQDNIRDQLYYDPAEKAAAELGLKFDVSQGQIFDTGIEHGTGDDGDGMLTLIKNTNSAFTSDQTGDSGSTLTINGHQVDEIVWLKKFIEIRTSDLKSPKEKDNQGGNYWAQTTYRTKSYSNIIDQGEYMWTSTVKLLDNDDLAIMITGIYENGDTESHYAYCENLNDGRGFTAGIAGFCTGTGDAWMVIQEYKNLTGSYGSFESMATDLEKYANSGSASSSGIKNYCQMWGSLGNTDKNFQQAQDNIRDQLYYDPAQAASNKLGLKFDVSQGQIFDTGIEHGTGDDADGMLALINNTNSAFTSDQTGNSGSTLNINGHQVDEIVWLKKFIEIRTSDLMSPKEKDNQGGNYWAQTTYRTKSYSNIIDQGEYMWTSAVTLLDNDSKPTTISCSSYGKINPSTKTRRRRRDVNGRPIRIRGTRMLVPSLDPPKRRIMRPIRSGPSEEL